jgi:valyl-tRNA synthetase
MVREDEATFDNRFGPIIQKLCNVSGIEFITDPPENAVSFIVKTTEYYIHLGDRLNLEKEIEKLEKELDYVRGFLTAVMKKLSNKKFVDNAPEPVVRKEMEKKTDAEARIRALSERLAELR